MSTGVLIFMCSCKLALVWRFMIFKTPFILLLIPIVIPAVWFWHRRQRPAALRFPSVNILPQQKISWRLRLRQVPFLLRLIAIVCFLTAWAGPRLVSRYSEVKTEGIDIVLALDISGSMAAEDFMVKGKRVNRLDVVKDVVKDFIAARRNDRIGIVAFSREAYTVSPLTTDQHWLLMNLDRLRLGLIEDGTAIGSGIASSLLRLQNSKAKSRIIILLTDGVNNAGKILPLEAAAMAEAVDIKVYTIGVGSKGLVPFPVQDIWGRKHYQNVQIDIDEEVLRAIAQKTGAAYFSADNTQALREIYQEIDRMERTEVEQSGYLEYQEMFIFFLIAGLIFLIIEIALRETLFLALP